MLNLSLDRLEAKTLGRICHFCHLLLVLGVDGPSLVDVLDVVHFWQIKLVIVWFRFFLWDCLLGPYIRWCLFLVVVWRSDCLLWREVRRIAIELRNLKFSQIKQKLFLRLLFHGIGTGLLLSDHRLAINREEIAM